MKGFDEFTFTIALTTQAMSVYSDFSMMVVKSDTAAAPPVSILLVKDGIMMTLVILTKSNGILIFIFHFHQRNSRPSIATFKPAILYQIVLLFLIGYISRTFVQAI